MEKQFIQAESFFSVKGSVVQSQKEESLMLRALASLFRVTVVRRSTLACISFYDDVVILFGGSNDQDNRSLLGPVPDRAIMRG